MQPLVLSLQNIENRSRIQKGTSQVLQKIWLYAKKSTEKNQALQKEAVGIYEYEVSANYTPNYDRVKRLKLFSMQYPVAMLITITIVQLLPVVTRSQCPEYFRYFRNDTTGEIMGTVEIPRAPVNVPLHLRVVLAIAAVLPTEYVGRLELVKSREESIRAILRGMPLFYQIYFPVRHPIPVVISISLNKMEYCLGHPPMGVVVTNIILEHTLYPPRVITVPLTEQLLDYLSNHSNSSPDLVKPGPPLDATTSMALDDAMIRPTAVPGDYLIVPELEHPNKQEPADSLCGVTSGSHPVTVNAETTLPTMWPWLAAIFMRTEKLEFLCTGNLISRLYVLTAAHCLEEDEDRIPLDLLSVSLGRFNLRDFHEPGSVNVDVEVCKFHPDYRSPESADSDLALVRLARRVDYSPIIRPICLWIGKIELDTVVGKFGYVVGWGGEKDKQRLSEPRVSKVPIVSQEDCLRSNLGFVEVTSNRTFCAGRRDGSGPCNGDSGSGLVMFHTRYNRYHLRGLVALSILDIKTRSCDLKEYVVYVDVAKYLQWIRQESIS